MIEIIQGTLGSGKSYYCIWRIFNHLKAGGVVCTNIRMVSDWSNRLANTFINRMLNRVFKRSYEYESNFMNSLDIDEISRVRIPGSKEKRGLLVIDEASMFFNARDWTKKDNRKWLAFFKHSRKLGWEVLLVAHRAEDIDAQIRWLAGYESTFRNMQSLKIPVIRVPLSPIPCFMKHRFYAGLGSGSGHQEGFELVPLVKHYADLYDTTEMFGFGEDHEVIELGFRPGLDEAGPQDNVIDLEDQVFSTLNPLYEKAILQGLI